MEIGMVNYAWDDFEQWVDDVVEMIPPHEQDARKKLEEARENLDNALAERREVENTINIEIREKSGEVKVLKSELRKTRGDVERQDLHMRIVLLEALVTDLKKQYQMSKDKVKECQAAHSESKKKLSDLKAERGKPEASIVAEVELYLENFKITRASYHGGDYNGVCCRRLVDNSKNISKEVRKNLIKKKNELCQDATINKKWTK